MAGRRMNRLVADFTPSAQRFRRERLEPANIAEQMRDWRDRTSDGQYYKAVDLIKLTEYLQCSAAERVELIDRILDVLDEVSEETMYVDQVVGPAGSAHGAPDWRDE